MRTQEIKEMEKRAEMYRKLLKWNILFLLGLLCWGSVRGQAKMKKQWRFGGNMNEYAYDMVITRDSGVVISGSSESGISGDKSTVNFGKSDYVLIKYDKNGNKLWDRTFGGDSNDILVSIVNDSENGIIGIGISESPVSGNKTTPHYGKTDLWAIRVDSLGNLLWQKTFGGDSIDGIEALSITNQYFDVFDAPPVKIIKLEKGGYLIATNSKSANTGNKTAINRGDPDIWALKINDQGNIIWQQSYGGQEPEAFRDVIEMPNQDLLLVALSHSDTSGNKTVNWSPNFWILRLDSLGNSLSQSNINGISRPGYEAFRMLSLNDSMIKIYASNDLSLPETYVFNYKIGDPTTVSGTRIKDKNNRDKFKLKNLDYKNGKILLSLSEGSLFVGSLNYNYAILDTKDSIIDMVSFKSGDLTGDVLQVSKFNLKDNLVLAGKSNSDIAYDKQTKNAGGVDMWMIEMSAKYKRLRGSVFPDLNSNCIFNKPSEYNIPKILVHNKTENTYAVTTDSMYTMYLFDRDTAVLKIINLDSNLYVACGKDSIVVDMTGKADTSGIDFPIRSNKTGHCINITSFSSGLLRPGRWGDYQLNYQNNAFDTAYNAYIEIEFDTAAIDSIKSPYSFTLTGTILRFNLGHVRPFGFSSVTYSIKLKTTVIIGSSHCHRAKVFPICNLYPSAVYDSSEIQPMMRCLPNDTVEFSLKNIGTKDQKDWGLVKSYEDIIIFKVDSFRLNKGDIRIWKYKLDTNKVYTAEVFNSNFHPVTPILIRHNDLCANRRPMIPANPALNFSRHDEAKEYEEACTIVRGSYDPNIKSVQPVGMFAEHYTSTGTELKYRIDFQNTGTDTAFRVVLIDTLSVDLDIASFVPGASSHPYSVEFGGRAVKFIFHPIALVDSFKNEPLSHGYVCFKIKHKNGITPKTKIENFVDIYFDYNAPVRTNTVFNTIFDTIQIYVPKVTDTVADTTGNSGIQGLNKTSIIVFPNPTTDKFFIQMSEPVKDLSIEIYDMQGRMIKTASSSNNQIIEVSAQGMTKGIYHIRVLSGEKLVVVKKVMVE